MRKISTVFRHRHPTKKNEEGEPLYIEGGRNFFQVRQFKPGPHPVKYREGKKIQKTVMRDHRGRPDGFWDDIPGAIFETEEEAQTVLQED